MKSKRKLTPIEARCCQSNGMGWRKLKMYGDWIQGLIVARAGKTDSLDKKVWVEYDL